jgi:hypothetical protein
LSDKVADLNAPSKVKGADSGRRVAHPSSGGFFIFAAAKPRNHEVHQDAQISSRDLYRAADIYDRMLRDPEYAVIVTLAEFGVKLAALARGAGMAEQVKVGKVKAAS